MRLVIATSETAETRGPRIDPNGQEKIPSHLKLNVFLSYYGRRIWYLPNLSSTQFSVFQHSWLGFFSRGIQAIQYKKNTKTIEALVLAVQQVIWWNCLHMFRYFFRQQRICSLIHFLHTCAVGIHGVFGTQSTSNVCNTTKSVLMEAMKVKWCNRFKIPQIR